MCNHYRNHPAAIQTWREYIGADMDDGPFSDVKIDVWPRRSGLVTRADENGRKLIEPMTWGVPCTMKGKGTLHNELYGNAGDNRLISGGGSDILGGFGSDCT